MRKGVKSNNNIFLQNRLENIICITTRDDIPAKPYEKGEVLSEAKEPYENNLMKKERYNTTEKGEVLSEAKEPWYYVVLCSRRQY